MRKLVLMILGAILVLSGAMISCRETESAKPKDLYIKALAAYFAPTLKELDEQQEVKTLNKAIKLLDSVISIENFTAKGEAWMFKGLALGELGKYDEALQAFDKALLLVEREWLKGNDEDRTLSLDAELQFIWEGKGSALLSLERYDEAIEACNRAIKINPEYASGWFTKGLSHLAKKEYNEALDAFDRTLDIDPAHRRAKVARQLVEGILKK